MIELPQAAAVFAVKRITRTVTKNASAEARSPTSQYPMTVNIKGSTTNPGTFVEF
jgi:hypothetical protein